MKNPDKAKAILAGARIATSDQVSNNKFLTETQREWEELQKVKEARVSARPVREGR